MPRVLPKQTPLYHSLQKDRYSRQEQITDIEQLTHRALIVYAANLQHPLGGIKRCRFYLDNLNLIVTNYPCA